MIDIRHSPDVIEFEKALIALDSRSPRALRRWKKRQAEKDRKQLAEIKAAYQSEIKLWRDLKPGRT